MLPKLINKHLFHVDQHHQQTITVGISKSGFMLVALLGPVFVPFVHVCWCFYQCYCFIILDILKLEQINNHNFLGASIVNMSHLLFLLIVDLCIIFITFVFLSYCRNALIVYFPLLPLVVLIIYNNNNVCYNCPLLKKKIMHVTPCMQNTEEIFANLIQTSDGSNNRNRG